MKADKKPPPKPKTISKLKKETWVLFSQYIRTRDCIETTGCASFGLCVTCGKRYHFKLLQAGHFIPGRHNTNLFSEKGVHAQCYNCNINLYGNTLEYRRRIIEMYGDGYDEVLEQEDRQIKKFTRQELEEMKIDLKAKIKALTDGV